MFQAGQRVGVAVSGGADSVCLLHVLRELAPRWNLRLRVLHLDHGLRGADSREDARFVRELTSNLGLPFSGEAADVAQMRRESGDNLEQAARRARVAFFSRFLENGELDRVATGHTRSDQAETVLFRFLRGAGSAGLAAIRPVTSEGLVRPLLEIERSETEEFLREHGIGWREDASNRSLDFDRNRIRRQLMPMLATQWNPGISATLAHTADWALAEEGYWEAELSRVAARCLRIAPDAVFLRTDVIAALPLAVGRRLLRHAIGIVKPGLRGVEFGHVQAVLDMAGAAEGHGRMQLPGVDVFRSFEWIRLARPGLDGLENRNFRLPLPTPGQAAVPGADSAVRIEVLENIATSETPESGYNEYVDCVDRERISGSVEMRNWRPGDQYHPIGHSGIEKIKTLFQKARIPLWERRAWPVVTAGDAIVWCRSFGVSARFAADGNSREILRIREVPWRG